MANNGLHLRSAPHFAIFTLSHSNSQAPNLIMIHDIKEDYLFLADFKDQSPSQIQANFMKMSSVKLPQTVSRVEMRIEHQIRQGNQNPPNFLFLRT